MSYHLLTPPAPPAKSPTATAQQAARLASPPVRLASASYPTPIPQAAAPPSRAAEATAAPTKPAAKPKAKPTSKAKVKPKARPVAARPAKKPARRARSAAAPHAIAVQKRLALGVPAHVVTVNTKSPGVRMTVALAAGGIGSREPWSRMINRLRPTAAITGTYFDTASFIPVGGLVVGGSAIHNGSVGTALIIDRQGRPRLEACRRGRRMSWGDCDTGLRAGPRLLTKGQVTIYPRWEGFRDPAITARKPRAAIGITRHGKLLLVTVARPLYLSEMARVMRKLGAVDAMCMDGGSSAGLYCRGKTYMLPRRSMTNVLLIYDNPARFERYARLFVPAPRIS